MLKLGQVSANLHDSFAQYRRTYRVFDENGRLMIQPLGEGPERLLKQEDGKFAFRSSPQSHISFVMQNDRATAMKMDSPGFPLAGDRVGDGDPATFHSAAPARSTGSIHAENLIQFPPALGRVFEADGMQTHLPGALDIRGQVVDEDGLLARAD